MNEIRVEGDNPELNESVANVLTQEIVRELIMEAGNLGVDEVSDELVNRILTISSNPWDAGMLYTLLERTGKL